MRANTLTPRQLWTQTMNNFSSKRNRDFEHFLEDPILAFQADSTIYQSPILIEIFLVAIKGKKMGKKTVIVLVLIFKEYYPVPVHTIHIKF